MNFSLVHDVPLTKNEPVKYSLCSSKMDENCVQKYSKEFFAQQGTLEYEISVPSGINVPPGKFIKINKHTPWKIESYSLNI